MQQPGSCGRMPTSHWDVAFNTPIKIQSVTNVTSFPLDWKAMCERCQEVTADGGTHSSTQSQQVC